MRQPFEDEPRLAHRLWRGSGAVVLLETKRADQPTERRRSARPNALADERRKPCRRREVAGECTEVDGDLRDARPDVPGTARRVLGEPAAIWHGAFCDVDD